MELMLKIKPNMKVFALQNKSKHIWTQAILDEIKSKTII